MDREEFHWSAPVISSRDVRCTRVFENLPADIIETPIATIMLKTISEQAAGEC
jgi:hypothetical protein